MFAVPQQYRVRAVLGTLVVVLALSAGLAPEASAAPAPPTPTGITVTATSPTSITVGWNNGGPGADGHRVYLSGRATPSTLPGDATTAEFTGLVPRTRYCVSVLSFTKYYASPALPFLPPCALTPAPQGAAPPAAPRQFSAVVTPTGYYLRWLDATTDETGWLLEPQTTDGYGPAVRLRSGDAPAATGYGTLVDGGILVASVGADVPSEPQVGNTATTGALGYTWPAAPGSALCFRLAATNEAGTSGWASGRLPVCANVPPAPGTTPVAPAQVTYEVCAVNRVTLAWRPDGAWSAFQITAGGTARNVMPLDGNLVRRDGGLRYDVVVPTNGTAPKAPITVRSVLGNQLGPNVTAVAAPDPLCTPR